MEKDKLLEKLGIAFTPMQEKSWDAILHTKNDIVLLSSTGTGKTYAYLLPISRLIDENSDAPQVVVLVPNRELAKQSMNVVNDMKLGIRSMALYGGRSTMEEHRLLRNVNPHIIISTPGRLNDHLEKKNFDVSCIQLVVIDEFDKCLEMGFQDEMHQLLEKLPFIQRRILLSATDSKEIPSFVNLTKVSKLDYRIDKKDVATRIKLYQVLSPSKDKLDILAHLLLCLEQQSSIVFLNYRESVQRVSDFLKKMSFGIAPFHGGLEQKERESALYKFSNGSANILISTNLGSRGLDIPNVDNIIHYHLPDNEEDYTHRIGRTARWDKKGTSFFILSPEEELPEYIGTNVETFPIPPQLPKAALPLMCTIYIGKGKNDKISKGDIVGFLCKVGGLAMTDIGKIDIMPRFSYVAVRRSKKNIVLKLTKGVKIKGLNTVVEEVI
ncbi:DEAD/DEAH box helicase [Prevotella brunnea]|uniref:DEAD/DEAH box helicase n=1 Tax=Prevotella brunnea TaxID=2508867 RepID=A0A5C8GEL0_9BACT|nr:DEAD/DEAH box helicase [Prevotella brunnea]TXJ59688.1 DEAD/DEAH box helicase [Prevotella brunnea]